ncbi:hypothetical protein M0R45_015809 [Rubus argutus]|uniref:Uncharacterized protein n=1 Tax=Rubus argutus TaxID=59490 RepID=A0AAW1XSP0_RUBAR
MIDYTSQEIGVESMEEAGCFAREIFYHGSTPFQFAGNASLFSCPPSTVRDKYATDHPRDHFFRLVKLSPCQSNPGNQIYAVLLDDLCFILDYCSIDRMPLVSCTKVHDYSLALANIDSHYYTLRWSIPASCQHCQETGKACMLKNEFTNQTDPQN